MSSLAQDLYFASQPPTVAGRNIVQNTATGAAAANFDWTTALLGASVPVDSEVHLALEAVTTDCYVRFKNTGAAGTTANNGRLIKAGVPAVTFWIDPLKHSIIDSIAPAGAGVLKVQVVSPPGGRKTI